MLCQLRTYRKAPHVRLSRWARARSRQMGSHSLLQAAPRKLTNTAVPIQSDDRADHGLAISARARLEGDERGERGAPRQSRSRAASRRDPIAHRRLDPWRRASRARSGQQVGLMRSWVRIHDTAPGTPDTSPRLMRYDEELPSKDQQ
jgi:hypothetical protein